MRRAANPRPGTQPRHPAPLTGSEPPHAIPEWFLLHFDPLYLGESEVPREPRDMPAAPFKPAPPPRKRGGNPGAHLMIIALALAAFRLGAQSGSSNYLLQQSTINGGGQTSTSANYRMTASVAQESVIGASSTPNYVLQSGFWSYYGSGLVPVLLMVHKNSGNPANPDLSWSGNNAPYLIYRQFGANASAACGLVFGGFLTSQTPAAYTDANPPASPLTCYNVLATAPGPTPPEGNEISPNSAGSLDPVKKDSP